MINVNEHPADQNTDLGTDAAEDSDLGDQVPAAENAPATKAPLIAPRSANIGHNTTVGNS